MAFPSNPTNNQTTTVNGILYTYNSTKGVWSVTTNSGVDYNVNSLNAAALVTAGNVRTTAGVFWANGAAYSSPASGTTTNIQYNSLGTFAGAANFTYTAQTGNVVIGATTATSSTTTGALTVAGGVGVAGNVTIGDAVNFTGAAPEIVFTAANPWINATSYIHFPGGAYFNGGTVYTEAAIRARGGISNDTGTKILTIGSTSQLSVANTTSATSTTTGALLVSGGVGIAGATYVGGNLTVGTASTNTRANLLIFGGNLNSAPGSSIKVAEFYTTNTNGDYLQIIKNRHSQGADWTSANTRIQQMIDITPQGYLEFNPVGATYGVAIGSGTTEMMRFALSGNVVINATTASTNTTTGALVVKGGIAAAGQVTAGNIMTTNGVFWANGVSAISSSAGDPAGTAVAMAIALG